MGNREPKIRSNWTRMMIDAYRRTLPADVVERGMANVDPRHLAALEASGPMEWLDSEVHLDILEGPFALVSSEEFRDSWRRHLDDSFERPIFRALVQGGLRLFVRTPLSLMAIIPNGWSLVSQNVGRFLIDADPTESTGRVRVVDLPPRYRASVAFATAWAGALESFLDLAEVEGAIALDLSRATRGEFVYDVRWGERAAAKQA